jgi:polyhydroxyalkanoate synthesis regulator phasin
MKDILKNGLLACVGLAAYTKKHLDQVAEELAKRGYTEEEGKKVLTELLKEGEKAKDNIINLAEKKAASFAKDLESGKIIRKVEKGVKKGLKVGMKEAKAVYRMAKKSSSKKAKRRTRKK